MTTTVRFAHPVPAGPRPLERLVDHDHDFVSDTRKIRCGRAHEDRISFADGADRRSWPSELM
jgi:hypothetical protein